MVSKVLQQTHTGSVWHRPEAVLAYFLWRLWTLLGMAQHPKKITEHDATKQSSPAPSLRSHHMGLQHFV